MTAATVLSVEEVQSLPPVLNVPTAGRLLGLGRAASYELVRRGEFPSPVLHLGKQLRVPTAPLLEVLGLRPVPGDLSGPARRRSAGDELM